MGVEVKWREGLKCTSRLSVLDVTVAGFAAGDAAAMEAVPATTASVVMATLAKTAFLLGSS